MNPKSPLRIASTLTVAASALVTASGSAAPAAPAPAAPLTAPASGVKIDLNVQRHSLPNGLRVVLNENRGAPTVAICVTYDVGSRNEQRGRSGFAHLFEHMMFQGSRNLEKGDHFKLISSRGGTLNGTTSSDRTNYYESLPSNGLELGLWLEADRMKTLAVTQENFENQRKVVQEEYRMRVSNQAYAEGMMRQHALVYGDYWPYAHDAIGSMEDLDNAQLEWIRDFHRSYYVANNAVLSISGDFEPTAALELVKKYFSDARSGTLPAYSPPPMAEQTAARYAAVEDANARTPAIYTSWPIPPNREPEHYALELATVILGFGDTSLLHQRLVRDLALASSAVSWTNDHRGPDVFTLRVVLSDGAQVDATQKAIDELVERLRASGPTEAELEKAKNRLKSFFVFGLQDNISRAQQLANYELFYGDAALLNGELDRYLAVTKEGLQAAVSKYLTPTRKNVVVVNPKAPATAP